MLNMPSCNVVDCVPVGILYYSFFCCRTSLRLISILISFYLFWQKLQVADNIWLDLAYTLAHHVFVIYCLGKG